MDISDSDEHTGYWFEERARWTPIRLSDAERRTLRLIEVRGVAFLYPLSSPRFATLLRLQQPTSDGPCPLPLPSPQATLNVSEYTDKIDIYSYEHKATRITREITEVLSIISGLTVASDYKMGNSVVGARLRLHCRPIKSTSKFGSPHSFPPLPLFVVSCPLLDQRQVIG